MGEREGGGGGGGGDTTTLLVRVVWVLFFQSLPSRRSSRSFALALVPHSACARIASSVPFREVGGIQKFPSEAGKKVSSEGPNQPRGERRGRGVGSSYSIWVASYLLASSY